jgi:hypothetical protein
VHVLLCLSSVILDEQGSAPSDSVRPQMVTPAAVIESLDLTANSAFIAAAIESLDLAAAMDADLLTQDPIGFASSAGFVFGSAGSVFEVAGTMY